MAKMGKARAFIAKCKRVWHSMTKPSMAEFQSVTKISAIGILALGVLGFLISLIMKVFGW